MSPHRQSAGACAQRSVHIIVGDLISENTQEGLAAARARGRVGGRPSVMTAGKLRVARQMLEAGSTVTEIAATIGVGRATLYRHLDVSPMPGRGGHEEKVT